MCVARRSCFLWSARNGARLTVRAASLQTRTGRLPISIVRCQSTLRRVRRTTDPLSPPPVPTSRSACHVRAHPDPTALLDSALAGSTDSGLKRFIKDRQSKHKWDDADEADFIKGTARSFLVHDRSGADLHRVRRWVSMLTAAFSMSSSRERARQGRQIPGEQGAPLTLQLAASQPRLTLAGLRLVLVAAHRSQSLPTPSPITTTKCAS